VTYHDDTFNEGISYALDLAKTMDDSLEILMIYRRRVLERIGDMMTVVTYAEAGEHKTAREMISEDYRRRESDYEEHVALLKERGRKSGIPVDVSVAAADTISAVKNIVRQNSRIEMILLGPGIAADNAFNTKTIKRLVKIASRPVVMMTRQSRQTNAA